MHGITTCDHNSHKEWLNDELLEQGVLPRSRKLDFWKFVQVFSLQLWNWELQVAVNEDSAFWGYAMDEVGCKMLQTAS